MDTHIRIQYSIIKLESKEPVSLLIHNTGDRYTNMTSY